MVCPGDPDITTWLETRLGPVSHSRFYRQLLGFILSAAGISCSILVLWKHDTGEFYLRSVSRHCFHGVLISNDDKPWVISSIDASISHTVWMLWNELHTVSFGKPTQMLGDFNSVAGSPNKKGIWKGIPSLAMLNSETL